MPYTTHYEFKSDYLHATTTGTFGDVDEMLDCAKRLRKHCDAFGIRKILHDERLLLTQTDPYSAYTATESLEADLYAQNGIRMAVICHPAHLDDTRIFETFLTNRSVMYKVFLQERDALAWLRD